MTGSTKLCWCPESSGTLPVVSGCFSFGFRSSSSCFCTFEQPQPKTTNSGFPLREKKQQPKKAAFGSWTAPKTRSQGFEDWEAFFGEAAAAVLAALPGGAVAVFYQTDVRVPGLGQARGFGGWGVGGRLLGVGGRGFSIEKPCEHRAD